MNPYNQPGYGQPPSGYGQAPSGYGAPTGYGQQPPSGYGAPPGYGIPQQGQCHPPSGYGQPQPPTGYGQPQPMGAGAYFGGQRLTHNYNISQNMISNQGRQVFAQADRSRNGTLNIQEGRNAVMLFCQLNGLQIPTDRDYQIMFQMFDYDRSGVLDYYEFQMLLEQMGGLRTYTQQDLMNNRLQRQGRLTKYRTGICQMF